MNEEWKIPTPDNLNPIDKEAHSDITVPEDDRDLLQKQGTPLATLIKDPGERAGKIVSTVHSVLESTTAYPLGRAIGTRIYKAFLPENRANDAPGWKPGAADIEGFPDDNATRDYILDSPNSAELASRQQEIRERLATADYYSNGIPVVTPILQVGTMIADPINKILPGSSAIKFSSFSKDILINTSKVTGSIALNSAIRESIIQADKPGGNIGDAIFDAGRDTIFAAGIHAGLRGAAIGFESAKLWRLRKASTMERDGFTTEPEINAKGEITGHKVVPNDLYSKLYMTGEGEGPNYEAAIAARELGIQKQKQYQEDFNHELSDSGLFGKWLGTTKPGQMAKKSIIWWSGSPYGKAMSTGTAELKSIISRLADNTLVTKGEYAGVPVPPSAEVVSNFHADLGFAEAGRQRQFYLKAMGIDNSSNHPNTSEINFRMPGFVRPKLNGAEITDEQYHQESAMAVAYPGYKSKITMANEAAHSFQANITNPTERVMMETGIIDAPFGSPLNAESYLPTQYHQDKITGNPDEFYNFAFNELSNARNKIGAINSTIELYEGMVNRSRIAIEELQKDSSKAHLLPEAEKNYALAIERRNKYIESLEDLIKNDSDTRLLVDREATRKRNAKLAEIEKKSIKEEEKGVVNNKKDKSAKLIPSPIFTKLPKTNKGLQKYVEQYRASITNTSAQDLQMGVFGINAGATGKTSFMKSRSIPISQQALIQGGWIETDLGKISPVYGQSTGKVIGIATAFPGIHPKDFQTEVGKMLEKGHAEREIKIRKNSDPIKREKELLKNKKKLAQETEFLNEAMDIYSGTYKSNTNSTLRKRIDDVRNLTTAVKSGSFAITSMGDLNVRFLKQRTIPALMRGLKPLLKSIPVPSNAAERKALKDSAASMGLALSLERSAIAMRGQGFTGTTMSKAYQYLTNPSKGLENAAIKAHTFSGFNAFNDMNERFMAIDAQSTFIRLAKDYLAGKEIPLFEKQLLARYGLDLEKDAKSFIDNYNKSGGYEQDGAFYSNSHNWNDYQSAYKFNLSVRRFVNDGLSKPSLFTAPFWTKNPIASMTAQFTGWSYEMFSRYAISAAQKPNKEAGIGILLMVTNGMMLEPILNLIKGKPIWDDEENWGTRVAKGVMNSGLLGPKFRWIQTYDAAFGGFFPTTARYKDRGPLSALGAGGGVIGDIGTGIYDAVKGETTETQALKDFKSIPYASTFYISGFLNNFIDQMEFPKTKSQTTPWAYRDMITK